MRGRIVVGLVLVLLGLGFLLDQAGYWDFGAVLGAWWPLVFVIVGVVHLFSRRVLSGVLFTALGAYLILNASGKLPGGLWGYLWPVALVAVGLMLLFSFGARSRRGSRPDDVGPLDAERRGQLTSGRLDRFACLGGDSTRVVGDFRGGEATAFMGGIELDMRGASLPPDGAELSATAIMGGIEIVVPESWRVETRGPAILGGVENKARSASGPLLSVRTTAIMGGIEIKHKT